MQGIRLHSIYDTDRWGTGSQSIEKEALLDWRHRLDIWGQERILGHLTRFEHPRAVPYHPKIGNIGPQCRDEVRAHLFIAGVFHADRYRVDLLQLTRFMHSRNL